MWPAGSLDSLRSLEQQKPPAVSRGLSFGQDSLHSKTSW